MINFLKFVAKALLFFRQPMLVKASVLVIYAGLGVIVPGFRDILLVALPLLINKLFDLVGVTHLPPMESTPWWAGLILVCIGLLFLLLQGQTEVEVTGIVKTNGTYVIQGRVKTADPDRAIQAMREALRDLTREELPPG